uniref:Ovule protein n=1 Tax=Haemonchus placei TaxID=6290 RepID=A0A0N4WQ39_HAEPC
LLNKFPVFRKGIILPVKFIKTYHSSTHPLFKRKSTSTVSPFNMRTESIVTQHVCIWSPFYRC